ncbi:MAG: transcriptional regulator, partial [Bacteroides sp.]|nr:transcriptional regulator [Bacteroides sp.]
RFMRNCGRAPMMVPDDEMERFIVAVSSSNDTKYYLQEEITPQMYGRKIRIVGGPLNGYEGCLITTRGSKVKRLMIKLQDFFAAGVEVNPEYIQFI